MSEAAIATVVIPVWVWAPLIFDLRKKGKGRGESGAFLLGQEGVGPARATRYVCYDDLDPDAYQDGAITFHAAGYAALWQRCKEKNLQVLADVHTHPGRYIAQSPIDQRNPMVPTIGHTAIIVPNFAKTSWWSLNGVGVYEYLGNFRWKTHPPASRPERVKLSLW